MCDAVALLPKVTLPACMLILLYIYIVTMGMRVGANVIINAWQ